MCPSARIAKERLDINTRIGVLGDLTEVSLIVARARRAAA
jgi:hypothetical protein